MTSKAAGRTVAKKVASRTYRLRNSVSPQEAADVVHAICADEVDALVVSRDGNERVYVLREPAAPGEESWETLRALRRGEIDAIVVSGSEGEQVHLLEGADSPYRVVVDAMTEGAAILSSNSSILRCNNALASLIGRSTRDLINVNLKVFVDVKDRSTFENLVRGSIRQTAHGEIRLRSIRGEEIPVALSLTPLTFDDMNATCLIVSDLRPVRRAEDALRESAEFNRQIVYTASEGIVVLDYDLRYQVWNRYMEDITGISAAIAIGNRPTEIFAEGGLPREEAARKALAGETSLIELPFYIAASGRSGMTLNRYAPLLERSGKIIGVLTTIREVSEEKRKEKELNDTAQQLRKLTARLNAVREEESIRISREIHDQLGGLLTVLKLELAMVQNDAKTDVQSVKGGIQKANALVDKIGETVQAIALDLRPPTLDQLGLPAAIEAELDRFAARTGILCEARTSNPNLSVPEETSISLFRIFEECLTNIARHAKASRVEVLLDRHENNIRLQVRDNGKGVDLKSWVPGTSLGLVGIRERALNLGGHLSIQSAPGQGMIVIVTIPMNRTPD